MRFETYLQPKSIAECTAALAQYGADARLLAGGTDVVPRLKMGLLKPQAVISMQGIPGMDAITLSEEGLTLGACASLRKISLAPELEKDYKVIREACGHVSSMQVRNMATIGGNACNASPSADAVQGLLVSDAVVAIASGSGERSVRLDEFFTGPGKTVLMPGEMVLRFFVPKPAPRTGCAYFKYAIRGDSDISIVGAGARITLDGSGKAEEARITLASVAPVPLRVKEAEMFLTGKALTEAVIKEAGEIAASHIQPITDQRASKEYRAEMARVWTRHALRLAYERAQK